MKSHILFKTLLPLLLLCGSCYTYISYPVATPPMISMDPQQERIAFINRFDDSNLPTDNENKKEVFSSGARQVIGGLETSFRMDEKFTFILIETLIHGLAMEDFPEVLPKDLVISYCNDVKSDMLLVMESFNAFFSTKTEIVKNEDGSNSTTNHVELVVEAGLSLYSSTGEIINRRLFRESELYQSRPALSRFIVIGPSMGKAGERVNALSSRLGMSYIDNFYPGNMEVVNKIYLGKEFSEVTPLMRNHDWAAAIDILLPMAQSPKAGIEKKATHNLAIAYDGIGDYEASDYWMKKSGQY